MNCQHTKTARRKDAPRVCESWRSQGCLNCAAFRLHAHNEDQHATQAWSKLVAGGRV